jgi:hypothetical protein
MGTKILGQVQTLKRQLVFVTARDHDRGAIVKRVLHCDKPSLFRHIAAQTVQFAVLVLRISGDNAAGPQRGY